MRCCSLFLAALVALPAAAASAAPLVPGQVLLRLSDADAPGEPDQRWKSRVTRVGLDLGIDLRPGRRLPVGWTLARVDGATDPRALARRLAEHPEVEAASPDWIQTAQLQPDDDELDQQWNLAAVGAEAAWDTTTGDPTTRIGIVDSGIRRNHRDLQGRGIEGYDFISDPAMAGDGDARDDDFEDDFDQAECAGQDVDGDFHGTAVTSVIAAHTDNGRGVAGLDWQASVVMARAIGVCGEASTSDLLDAIAWLAGLPVDDVPALEGGAVKIVNLSFGRPGACSPAEQDLAAALAARGVWLVAPTGNDVSEVMSPASCPEVLSVAAHGPGVGRPRTGYSAHVGPVDLIAPGGDLAAEGGGLLALSGDGRNSLAERQGTSLAAAHVSGALALLAAAYPDLTRRQVREVLIDGGALCDGCDGVPALDIAGAFTLAASAPEVVGDGAPCGGAVLCDEGLACVAMLEQTSVCRPSCGAASGEGCPGDQHCLPIDGLLGEAACFPVGPIQGGGPCQLGTDCAAGHVCVLDDSVGVGVCEPQCNHGFSCPDTSAECVALNPFQSYCADVVEPEPEPEPEPETPEPETPTGPDGLCKLSHGNLDCGPDLGCLEDHDGDDVGFCGPWTGIAAGGARCADRYRCASGVCETGVCLFECDEGSCAPGWTCGEEGLCHPMSCADGCASGFDCEDVEGSKICVRPEGGCTAVPTSAEGSQPLPWGLALLGVLWLRGRRRGSL